MDQPESGQFEFACAAPLTDRIDPDASIDFDEEVGRRRLARWRRSAGFEDDSDWQTRLAADGLDDQLMMRLLGEIPQSLGSRVSGVDWTAWWDPEDSWEFEPSTRPPEGDISPEDVPYFAAPVAGRLIFPTVRRLRDKLVELSAGATSFDPIRLTEQLSDALLWQVHRMLGRTMSLELHLARNNGELTAEHPQGRFAQFMGGMRDPARQARLFRDYPVLARQIITAVRQWYDSSLRLIQRIIADGPLLRDYFADGVELGAIQAIRCEAGDQHLNGQTVAIVDWDSGITLVYKPRSMRLDIAFTALVDWLNEAGLAHSLRTTNCLDRGTYGWSEFLEANPCTSKAEIQRFYHRQGAMLALLALLRANDMHAENLIAVGEHPMLIDLETLCQPRLPGGNNALADAEKLAQETATSSVLQVGLLPVPAWITRDGRSVDLSGLGHRPGQQTSMSVPMLADFGTDAMRVKLGRPDMDMPDHRPVAKDVSLNLIDYADDLFAGYSDMHRLCRRRRMELLAADGPLSGFKGASVRVLLQSTVVYGTLLRTAYHPDLLRDSLERDRHFDFLWRRVRHTPALSPTIAAERRDLWRNDIPYFSATVDGTALADGDGTAIEGLTLTPGLELVQENLRTWDEDHLRAQLSLIRSSLAAATINADSRLKYPEYRLPEVTSPQSAEVFVEAAIRIAERLKTDAHVSGSSAQWLGLNSKMGRNWQAGPLGPDIFNGLTGVALFLGQLGAITGDNSYRSLALQAVTTVRHQLNRQGTHTLHGMAGLPGIAYGFCRLADLLGEESLRDIAGELAVKTLNGIGDDAEFDFVSGGAGTIAALRILHEQKPEGPAADAITAAADHLVASAVTQSTGVGWLPALIVEHGLATQPLSGFGHGTAGIAWALGEAYQIIGDQRYADIGAEAIRYERTLFDAAEGAWRDVRTSGGETIAAWCHGAVGIGISRLGLLDTLLTDDSEAAKEVTAALDKARGTGYGMSHSLCHGDFGTTDLFLHAARALGDDQLRAEVNLKGAAILRSIETGGWQCGIPYGEATPSLMVGLAGIGYGFLRIAEPDRVASVLSLAVPAEPGRDRS